MTKIIIQGGHTNQNKYVEDNIFFIEKTYTGFNHLLKYSLTQDFPFVPRLLKDTKEVSEWEYIAESSPLSKPTSEDLQELGRKFRTIHLSNVKLPKNNLRQRIHHYLKKIHDKGVNLPEIEDNYRLATRILANMSHLNPVHNDLWNQNIIKDKENKIWIIDWEYASMGDKHFDLAYFIESSYLDDNQAQTLLDAYDSVENEPSYSTNLLQKYRFFVNWVTLCWMYAQDQLPFPPQKIISRVKELTQILNNKQNPAP